MGSVVRRMRKRKRCLGEVRVLRREEYQGLELNAKVELIRSLIPLGLMHVQMLLDDEVVALAGPRHAHADGAGGRRALICQFETLPGPWCSRGAHPRASVCRVPAQSSRGRAQPRQEVEHVVGGVEVSLARGGQRPLQWRAIARIRDGFHLIQHVQSLDDLTEDGVVHVEARIRPEHDEELTAVGVRTGIGRGQHAGLIVLRVGVELARELITRPARAGPERITALGHEPP